MAAAEEDRGESLLTYQGGKEETLRKERDRLVSHKQAKLNLAACDALKFPGTTGHTCVRVCGHIMIHLSK